MASYDQYVKQMYSYARMLEDYVDRHGLTRESLSRSTDHQWAVTTPLMVIGESARNLVKRDIDLGQNIELHKIAGLRNRMTHNYEGTDWNIVEQAVFEDIPRLVENLRVAMAELGIEDTPEDTDAVSVHGPEEVG